MVLRTTMKAGKAAKKASKAAKADPKPKFKADRKLDKEIDERLAKQNKIAKDADRAKAKGDKPKAAPKTRVGRPFEQTAREKAADKAPKPKTDTRVERAGGNVTGAQRNAIDSAPSVQALTSLKSKLNKEVDALKNATAAEKKERKDKIAKMVNAAKAKIDKKATDAVKSNKPDTRPASKKPQSAEERRKAKVGDRRSIGTGAWKKEGMGDFTSYTSMKRADAILKAGNDLRSNKITEAKYKAIMRAIGAADQIENTLRAIKRRGKNKPVSLSQMIKGKPDKELRKGGYVNCGASTKPNRMSRK
jgi:hypothetical protein